MAGISVWILMYAVAANLSVWFFSSALLLYRQFILQSSNTLRLVTAQEIKQFRIKLEAALQKGTDNRSIFWGTTAHTNNARWDQGNPCQAPTPTAVLLLNTRETPWARPNSQLRFYQRANCSLMMGTSKFTAQVLSKGKLQPPSCFTESAPNCNQHQ